MRSMLTWIGFAFLVISTADALADVVVYDDQSENGFHDGCSFGGVAGDFDVANTVVVHSGTHSIRFKPDSFNAVSWCAPATYSATADYTGIDFWVNGGATGSQNVNLVLGLAGNAVAQASLQALQGIPLAANLWVHFRLTFADPGGLNYSGQFDRISFQDESGTTQADMYFDDVTLVSANSAAAGNYIFGDSFEPEYLLVPQYNQGGTGSINVYQRTTNTTPFAFLHATALPPNANPNALAFAPDGSVWVVDDGNRKLLRFDRASVLGGTIPTLLTVVTASAYGSLYDLAFFGTDAYVSSDNGVLKYSLASLNVGGTPVPTVLGSGGTPVGLAFDAQGRLWICNYGAPGNLVRMTTAGTIEVTIAGNNINNAEGLAFDEFGSLWVADNVAPVMYGYGSSQIAADGSPSPIGQINTPDGAGHPGFTGYAGGIAFDRRGDMRVNYEYDYSVRAYTATATPWSGPYTSYTSTELTALSNATTDPGRGGVAIWPVPHTIHR